MICSDLFYFCQMKIRGWKTAIIGIGLFLVLVAVFVEYEKGPSREPRLSPPQTSISPKSNLFSTDAASFAIPATPRLASSIWRHSRVSTEAQIKHSFITVTGLRRLTRLACLRTLKRRVIGRQDWASFLFSRKCPCCWLRRTLIRY